MLTCRRQDCRRCAARREGQVRKGEGRDRLLLQLLLRVAPELHCSALLRRPLACPALLPVQQVLNDREGAAWAARRRGRTAAAALPASCSMQDTVRCTHHR
jgi:hypothetical protein